MEDDAYVWAQSYERELADVLRLQRVNPQVYLHGDANPAVRFQDRALDHGADPECAGDFGERLLAVAERLDRATRDDADGIDPSQTGNQRFGHAVGEEIFVRVTGEVLERQHGEHDLAAAGSRQVIRGEMPASGKAPGERQHAKSGHQEKTPESRRR